MKTVVWFRVAVCFVSACTPGSSGGTRNVGNDSGAVRSDTNIVILPGIDAAGLDGAAAPSGFFDACGGRIVRANGSIDVVEYNRQAGLWSRETVDCRLGPKYADIFGSVPDPRPTAFEPARRDCSGTCAAAYPQYYQLGSPRENHEAFGHLTGQVAYYPDAQGEAGMDEFWSFSWAYNAIVEEPWMSLRPARYTDTAEWMSAFAATGRRTIAVHRSQLGESTGGLALFQTGHIGGLPDRYGSSSNAIARLPNGFVPTAIATSNALEFAFVTAWNTADQTGHLFVIGIADALPQLYTIRSWTPTTQQCEAQRNCPSYDPAPFKILGHIQLPIATPSAVAVSFDNGSGHADTYLGPRMLGNPHDNGLSYEDPAVRATLELPNGSRKYHMAHSGYAVVLSRWENRAVFIDLQPLITHTRRYFAGTQTGYQSARNNRGNAANQWPYSFEVAPEQTPRVVASVEIPHPTFALAGRFGASVTSPITNLTVPIKTHIASLDGTIRTFDVGGLGTPSATDAIDIRYMYSLQVGANPVAMQWPIGEDLTAPHGVCLGGWVPCTAVNHAEYNDHFLVLSRAARELNFVVTTENEARVYRRIRDSRLEDPVAMVVNQMLWTTLVSIGDWSEKKVVNFRIGPISGEVSRPQMPIGAGAGGNDDFECGGTMRLPGNVYSLTITNTP